MPDHEQSKPLIKQVNGTRKACWNPCVKKGMGTRGVGVREGNGRRGKGTTGVVVFE